MGDTQRLKSSYYNVPILKKKAATAMKTPIEAVVMYLVMAVDGATGTALWIQSRYGCGYGSGHFAAEDIIFLAVRISTSFASAVILPSQIYVEVFI